MSRPRDLDRLTGSGALTSRDLDLDLSAGRSRERGGGLLRGVLTAITASMADSVSRLAFSTPGGPRWKLLTVTVVPGRDSRF